jgi:CheR methyltransferase, SAM binding domain
MVVGVRLAWAAAVFLLSQFAVLSGQSHDAIAYLSYERARPVFEALGERLPAPSEWPEWIAEADRQTRARVAQGDEISVVNLLLFGTSFTSEPRITSAQLNQKRILTAITGRLADFERVLTERGSSRAFPDDRLAFARQVVGGAPDIKSRLLSMLNRAIAENEIHERLIRDAEALGDPSLQFAERSRMYRARGLASDTSIRASFAVEEALRGLTVRRPVRRVAVIGPGLDFTDKQEGYDFYPQQSIQPFAVIDSLLRLELASADGLSMTTMDLNARVNDHLGRAVDRARTGSPYIIHLALPGNVSWKPEFLKYWQTFGETIGTEMVLPPIPRAVGPVKVRTISVRPSAAIRITPHDINITAQHVPVAAADRFDLIIATNVFVYYDRLQQGLAMANIADMLTPGGLLLSNNALVEVPATGLTSIGYSKALYSDRDEDGDLIIRYQKVK